MNRNNWSRIFLVFLLCLPLVACEKLPGRIGGGSDEADDHLQLLQEACADFQVVVIGGEPEGVAAAIGAARRGQSTLLLVAEEALGGLFTIGRLNFLDLSYSPEGNLLHTGIFSEFYRGIGGGDAFDVERAKAVLWQMAEAEPYLTIHCEECLTAAICDRQSLRVLAVETEGPAGNNLYLTPMLIDATADGDVAAACGLPYNYLREDYGDHQAGMAATLILPFTNVDWPALQEAAKSGSWGYAKSHSNAAWGFAKVADAYRPQNERTRLRGLNIGRQADGSVLINALQIFGVDPLDPDSCREGIQIGREEARQVLLWLRANMGGFAQAQLGEFPQALYIRESRHILGEYLLTVHDLLENRIFDDAIAFGAYPLDVQASSPLELGFVVGAPKLYSVPLRSLLAAGHQNLLVAGKAASYSSLAAGSARVVPLGMGCGQAAGVAAALAVEQGVDLTKMAQAPYYQGVQQALKEQVVKFYTADYGSLYPQGPHTPGLKRMVELGLVAGGYHNNFPMAAWLEDELAGRQNKPSRGEIYTLLAELFERVQLLYGP